MKNVLSTLSTIGALLMAATPIIAIVSTAHAETTPAHVIVGDLNLGRPEDAARFYVRVNTASQSFCSEAGDLIAKRTCRQAIQDEAVNGLSASQRKDLRSADARRS